MTTVAEIDKAFMRLTCGFVELQNELEESKRKLDAVREIVACTAVHDEVKVARIQEVIKNV